MTDTRIRDWPKIYQKRKAYLRNWWKQNPKYKLLNGASERAKARGLEFDLVAEDIIIPKRCPYLGIELTIQEGKALSNISLDRIDNSKGYVKGNVEVISKLANVMKNSATQEQLVTFAQNVLTRYGEPIENRF